jgi:hypothetical protein
MFEESNPPVAAKFRRIPARELPDCDSLRVAHDEASSPSDDEVLRAIEWGELTARLSAARDFRRLLRDELEATATGDAASFAAAAARYFRARDEDQPDVNPLDLEHHKGSSGMFPGSGRNQDEPARKTEHAQAGDAREEQ